MRLVLYSWEAYNEQILLNALRKGGHDIVVFKEKCNNYTRDLIFGEKLLNCIYQNKCEGVISFNYIPIISMICDVTKTKYYSWIYDCPHLTLYAKTTTLECNRIGVFDKEMAESLRNRGVMTAFHLPLATDVEKFDEVINSFSGGTKYDADVSFVGTLYTDEYNYFDKFYPPSNRNGIDEIVKRCCFKQDITEEIQQFYSNPYGMKYAIKCFEENGLVLGEDYYKASEEITMASLFEKKITIEERTILLKYLNSLKGVDFKWYTGSKTPIKNYGPVKYDTEMPIVFNRSKININLSLRSIHSGISLRIMDIMTCGGFVLSSRQPELMDNFIEGEDIAFFSTPDECEDKIKYYLMHEDERKNIAFNGRKKVAEMFSYEKLLPQLLKND